MLKTNKDFDLEKATKSKIIEGVKNLEQYFNSLLFLKKRYTVIVSKDGLTATIEDELNKIWDDFNLLDRITVEKFDCIDLKYPDSNLDSKGHSIIFWLAQNR